FGGRLGCDPCQLLLGRQCDVFSRGRREQDDAVESLLGNKRQNRPALVFLANEALRVWVVETRECQQYSVHCPSPGFLPLSFCSGLCRSQSSIAPRWNRHRLPTFWPGSFPSWTSL